MKGDLAGQVVLITGAGGGLGRAIAQALAAQGATLALNDVDPAAAAAVATEVGGLALPADVTQGAAVEAMVRLLLEHQACPELSGRDPLRADARQSEASGRGRSRRGRLDGLVHSVGVPFPLKPLPEIDDAEWQRTLALYLTSTFLIVRAVLPAMLRQGHGRIVTIGSVCGLTGCAGAAAYSAAKAGIIGLSKALAREAAPRGITVNVVAPGFIETDFLSQVSPAVRERLIAATPLGRLGRPAEVASLVCCLLSAEAGFITGQVLSPNGGYLI